jgi:hypothetical protein
MIRAVLLAALAGPAMAQGDPLGQVRTLEELAADIERTVALGRAEGEGLAAETRRAIEELRALEEVSADPGLFAPIIVSPLDAPAAAPAPPRLVAPPLIAPPLIEAPASVAVAPTPEAVEAAFFGGGDLPEGPAALTVKVQVLLDRAGISPGVVDGVAGGMSTSALAAFEAREGLPVDGVLDADAWAALGGDVAAPILFPYTVTADDLVGLAGELPTDYAELATLPALPHERVTERLAERFHMDEDFLRVLNPGASFWQGETVYVVDPGPVVGGLEVAYIEVRKSEGRLAAFDAMGAMVANYPVTVGSAGSPRPPASSRSCRWPWTPPTTTTPRTFVQGENLEL